MTKYKICVIADKGGCRHALADDCQYRHNLVHESRDWCDHTGCNDLHKSHEDGVCRDATDVEVAAARLRGEL